MSKTKTNYKKCFVIMPFSETTQFHTTEYWSYHWNHFLKPTISSIDTLNVERSTPFRKNVLNEIIKNLIYSEVVIADITDFNANVFWELGVRQSFQNRTIVIAEEGTIPPFDISIKSVLHYPKYYLHPDMSKFKTQLIDAIIDCLNNRDSPDSHVLETISGRGTISEIIQKEDTIRKIDAIIHECDSNIEILSESLTMIRDNRKSEIEWKKLSSKKELLFSSQTQRLNTNSIALLLSTRYLKKDIDFYLIISAQLSGCEGINSIFATWNYAQEQPEIWLKKNIPRILRQTKKLKNLMQKIQNELEKTI